jgi:peptidoglycan/xylan/chitin deacetylase (PgdA/CDA1 family)
MERMALHVVLYHHLADEAHDLTSGLRLETPPAVFEAHVERLARDYEIIDLEQVLAGQLPRRALLLTFDDGYRSVLDVGLPILARLGLPSVFFVSEAFLTPSSLPSDCLLSWLVARHGLAPVEQALTAAPPRAGSFAELLGQVASMPYTRMSQLTDELAARFDVDPGALRKESGLYLERDELRSLGALGCTIGNHTRSHVFCRCIVDDAIAAEELTEARRRLEQASGQAIRAFSYPYGYRTDATPFVERSLAESGHEATFLVESRSNGRRHSGPWNRVSLHDRPVGRLPLEVDVLPRLRTARDWFRRNQRAPRGTSTAPGAASGAA